MLVVISDLHLIDSTAGRHNIDPEWFENVFLNYIPSLAERKQAKELKVLLMGDIVDLIRTEKWLDTPPPIRPWGEEGRRDIEKTGSELSESETQKRCLEILGDREDLEESGDHDKKTIYARNWRTFKLFKKDFAEKVRAKMGDDFKVELLYLPGNHDRLCNLYPGLRNELKDTLGLSVNESTVMGDPTGRDWWYHPYFKDESYGVYARHGHEYDIYNYGGANNLTRAGQIQVSIGDVMAPEFAVKVPRLVREYAEGGHYKIPDAESLVARLQEGDNVRPVSSVVEWFYYSIKDRDAGDVRRALKTPSGRRWRRCSRSGSSRSGGAPRRTRTRWFAPPPHPGFGGCLPRP